MTTTVLNQTRTHGTWSPFGSKGDDHFAMVIPAGQKFAGCTLTVTGKRFNAGSAIAVQPQVGAGGTLTADVHWWYDGASEISYRIEAYATDGTAAGPSARVPGFLPSRGGFQFRNSFMKRPDLVMQTPTGPIAIGDASNGLCGGMAYAARDYHEARLPVPPGTEVPDSGPLFDYLVHRLFDSFDIPGGVLKYLELMNPTLPDHETDMSRAGLLPHGRSWRMVVEEWPGIKADLDAGHLCPLGLVLVKSADPGQLGHNHQVLAYGYDISGDQVSVCIYDPNAPSDDSVRLSFLVSHPDVTKDVVCNGSKVYAFFRSRYAFETPPGGQVGATTRVCLAAAANNKLVCAENQGQAALIANRTQVGPWETFEACVVGSNRIALRSLANNKYVCAENAGSAPLIANRDQIGTWETFELHYVDGNRVALKSMSNQRYVRAEGAGAKPLIASGTSVGTAETFDLRAISH